MCIRDRKELEQAGKWEEFCAFLQKKGDPFAAFLSTVPMVEWKDSRLTLYTSHAFYRDWVDVYKRQGFLHS